MVLKYFSAFAGIGGFDEGIRRAIPDAECVGYSEIDKYAIKIYEKHFSDRTNYRDIQGIDAGTLPEFDIFCGGFPCQDLSIAGKRAGLCGTRSGLFFEIIRIIREKQPELVFLENVKGLFSSNKGWDFARILIELDESGYDIEWQCLNSKNFGVPQNRERVFIIGHLRGKPWKPIFPIEKSNNGVDESNATRTQTNITPTIDGRIGAKTHRGTYVKAIQLFNLNMNGRREKEDNEEMFTLDSIGGQGVNINSQIRQLTPIECERLQGYPDGWTDGISDTQRYKCLGNAVTVNVIEAIVRKIN